MLIENISDLMVFTQAVKAGSLSAAGRELGISLAVASKRLQRLEEQLGVRLLNRSTRQLSLTEQGRLALEQGVMDSGPLAERLGRLAQSELRAVERAIEILERMN